MPVQSTVANETGTFRIDRVPPGRYDIRVTFDSDMFTGNPLDLFTIEPPVIDFSGLATLYDWKYGQAASEADLAAFLAKLKGKVKSNTLLELKLDPAVKPVTASRHF